MAIKLFLADDMDATGSCIALIFYYIIDNVEFDNNLKLIASSERSSTIYFFAA
jgi:hypothetical protein